MFQEQEDVFYYITVMNENYEHPGNARRCRSRHPQGHVPVPRRAAEHATAPRVQLLGSGTIFREVIAAADLLKNDWGVDADLWGCPSFNELARDGHDCARWNLLQPDREAEALACRDLPERHARPDHRGDRLRAPVRRTDSPVLTSTRRYVTLGTDGFGRSDTREQAAPFLRGRSSLGHRCRAERPGRRRRRSSAARSPRRLPKYGIDPNKPNPMTV